jgi:shikimate dehydrogenase
VGESNPTAAGRDITGETQLVGVMGWPVAHSLSPRMHNAVLQALGLDWCYVPLPVQPGMVEAAIRGIAALGFRGINVTVPHKRAVMASLDKIAPEAAAVGAVNTIVVRRDAEGVLAMNGHNTDVPGFLGSLRAGGFEPSSARRAVVLGAGGAARAVVYALLTTAVGAVIVLNRSLERAEGLLGDLAASGVTAGRVRVLEMTSRTLVESVCGADLLVNATTVGMWPETNVSLWPDGESLPAELTVYDLVYNPLETRLLAQARRSGAKAIDGLGMLARQGALALDMWLGGCLDIDHITSQMRVTLEKRWGGGAQGS